MRLVIALGGNALGNTPKEQLDIVNDTARTIVDLVEDGHEVVISHGNGPQVGMLNLAMEFASLNGANTPMMPFAECGAMSQGYIGYHLQQSIGNELKKRDIKKCVTTLITQVLVDSKDEAFDNPTKPVGMFYSVEEAKKLEKEKGFVFIEDSGRGYRRVVPSPMPQSIVELDAVNDLVSKGNIVITSGGGGIPVALDENSELYGIAAVIDKDKSSAKLARELEADKLIILTAVERVCINFNKENQEGRSTITLKEAEKYIEEGQFAKGSMLPKIEACIDFVKNSNSGSALITSLEKAKDALSGKTGTKIIK